jgi:hypothetical protein
VLIDEYVVGEDRLSSVGGVSNVVTGFRIG